MIEFLIDQALKEAIDLHNRNQLEDAKSLYNKIIEHDYKAVGEIGIDLFHEKKFLNQQIFVFEEQIKLALENPLSQM